MASVIEEIGTGTDASGRYDATLQNLLAQHGDDPSRLLATVLAFLQQRTGFFNQPGGQKRVAALVRGVTGELEPAAGGAKSGVRSGFFGAAPKKAAAARPAAAPSAAPPAPADAPAASTAPPPAAATASAGDPSSAGPSSAAGGGPPSAAGAASALQPMDAEPAAAAEEGDEPSSKGLKPNAGNGADLGAYSWTQSLQDLAVAVPVPPGTKGRGCDVTISKKRLRVGLKGQPPILEGELPHEVKPDDSTWNLSDGKLLEMLLAKQDGMRWWAAVLQGQPEIDTTKVEPENSKLTDLDGDTRATVEKMMYDQRQKQLGLPTADDQQKQAMLQKFMSAHPEMDFSNAKIS